MPNLVSLTCPSLQIGGISDFQISGQSLIKRNCRNFRNSDNTDMKLGQVTKLDKRKKKLTMTLFWQIVTPLSFFRFMADPEQFGRRITEA